MPAHREQTQCQEAESSGNGYKEDSKRGCKDRALEQAAQKAVVFPSLKVFRTHLDAFMCILIQGLASAGGMDYTNSRSPLQSCDSDPLKDPPFTFRRHQVVLILFPDGSVALARV